MSRWMRHAAGGLALQLVPAIALANEAAEHEHAHGHAGIPWATLIFSTINAAIFVFLIVRFAWPQIRTWISERRATIVQALEHAARAKRDAEQLKHEWEQRVAALQAEIDAMRQQAQADIARERDHILAEAQRTAANIRRDAERAAQQAQLSAQAQLREEVARRALSVATERARQQLTAADQDRFIADFLQQVRS